MKKIFFIVLTFVLSDLKTQNIAPQATASASTCNTGTCATLNDLNFGTCGTQQMWITSAATNPGSAIFIQFTWPSTKIINKITFHVAQDLTRFLGGGTVQYWNGTTWVNHYAFTQATGVCIYSIDFPAVATTQIRIIDIVVIGTQSSNVNFREIEIFGPSYRHDAGVALITNPEICNASQRMDATVFNFGLNRLDSFRLNWSINGIQQATQYITSNLLTGQSTVINLANPFNFSPSTNYVFRAWTSFPNGMSIDSGAGNDEFIRNVEFLGNPNPPTVVDAVQCGQGLSSLRAIPDNNGDSILWYNNSSGGTPIAIGRNAVGPFLTSNRTFYAQASKIATIKSTLANTTPTTGVNVTQANDYGAMFNVTVLRDVVLDSISLRLWYATPTNPGFQLYFKSGAYTGFQTNSSAWTKVSEGIGTFIASGGFNRMRVTANNLFLQPGTYSFYVTTDISLGSGNAFYNLLGGAGVSNADLTLQNAGSIIIGKFGATQVLANYVTEMAFLYKQQCANGTRLPYNITVKPRPIGANVIQGTPFQGQYKLGVMSDPDVIEVGKTITYELIPPTGYNNADHGLSWIINSVEARTRYNTLVPILAYTVTPPSSSGSGSLSMIPTSQYLDSFITFTMNYSDLLTTMCDSTIKRTLYVAPTPKPMFTFPSSVCVGDEILFENNSTIHSGIMNYEWDFDDGSSSDFITPVHSFSSSRIFNVKLTAISDRWNVRKDTIIAVNVGQLPIVQFSHLNKCEGENITFINNSSSSSGTLNFDWNFGDNTTLSNASNSPINHLYAAPGGYKVTLIAEANGCKNTLSKNVYQFARPKANFNLLSGNCSNEEFVFINSSTLSSGQFGNKWNFNDNGNIASDFNTSYTFQSAGVKNVMLLNTSEFGCKDSISKPITVKQAPISDFTYDYACERISTPFNNTTNLFGETLLQYEWNFGQGVPSSATNPNVNWLSVGPKNVSLKTSLSNGCSDIVSKLVEVKLQPKAEFESSSDCIGNEAIFTNLTTYRNGVVNYKWLFGDGSTSTIESPVHVYNSSQTYSVKLIANLVDGCSDSIIKTVSVSPLPSTCDFNYTRNWNTNFKNFTLTPSGGSMSGINYVWIMGDGNTLNSSGNGTMHTYIGNTKYCVTMIASNQAGCECSTTKCIDVMTDLKVIENQNFNVYPNPSNGLFSITFENEVSTPTIKIFNILGKLIYETYVNSDSQALDVDLSHLAKGIYSINVTSNGTSFVKNIVIQ
ncbi:MAG: PKD domain-containing protein [Bacteroidota bacterium]|nr:PKD domain-containing protein [Bacteroidota bacterium]